jgi:hypothetical protein
MSLEILKVKGVHGDQIATIYATDGGTVSMRAGFMSLAFTLDDWTEIHRELGNAICYARGLLKKSANEAAA